MKKMTLTLEAIIRELEEEAGEDEDERDDMKKEEEDKEEMEEQSKSSDIGKGDNKVDMQVMVTTMKRQKLRNLLKHLVLK